MPSMPAGTRGRRQPISEDQPVLRPPSSAATDGGLSAGYQANGGPGPRRSRRSVLRTGILGGAATLIAAGGMGAVSTAALAAGASPAAPHQLQNLFTLSDLDFETLFAFGSAGYGCAEFGELVTAVNQVNTAGASYQTYYDAFLALARSTEALAGDELVAGHTASARSAYLRASTYNDMCLYFILGTSARAQEAGAYAAMERCWQGASQLSDPPFEQVRIPYEASWLPGWLLRPDDRPVRRPTVVLNNGSDSQSVALYAFGGAAAIERGYNALIFEGPGQGSMLFERQVPFRPDWENVITPVVDYLRSRPDVDHSRIALSGWSLGAELVIQAAAFEHRLAAVVADPGFLSAWLLFQTSYPPIASLFAHGATKEQVNAAWQTEIVPKLNAVDRYTLAKRSEPFGRQFLLAARAGQVLSDLYALGTTAMQFSCAEVVDRVTAPTLVTAYQYDQYVVPASQGTDVYEKLASPKQYYYFTAAEGAQYHCAPMAPQTRNQVVYDWLDRTL
jgi:Acetyl xylan esterase (AXE1)